MEKEIRIYGRSAGKLTLKYARTFTDQGKLKIRKEIYLLNRVPYMIKSWKCPDGCLTTKDMVDSYMKV